MIACLIQILTINPSLVIGMGGAVFGFFIFYVIPFFLRKSNLTNGQNEHIDSFASNPQKQISKQIEKKYMA